MEKVLMQEPKTIMGKMVYYTILSFFMVAIFIILFLALQGVPALGIYLQNHIGTVKTGYYFVSVVMVLTPATLLYILFSKQ